jgi:hypothetical protein
MGVTVDPHVSIHPLAVEDYEAMVAAGILAKEDKVELINGVLADVTPQGIDHAVLIQWLTGERPAALIVSSSLFGCNCRCGCPRSGL